MLCKEQVSVAGKYPVYSSESSNNGIIGYTNTPDFICDENTPVYITFGDHTRTFNVAKESFSVLDNVKVLIPCTNNVRSLLFMMAVWKKQIPNLGYSRHWKVAKDCTIFLPQTVSGEIDYSFMEDFVYKLEKLRLCELEASRLCELNAYLESADLNNYELSDDDKDILGSLENLHYSHFTLKRLFNHIEQGSRLKKTDQKPGKTAFVMSGVTNTGVVNYISNPIDTFPANSITIDIFGNTFYRNYVYGAGDDTGVYWNDNQEYSKRQMLYMAASISKMLKGKYSYGHKLRSSQSHDFEIVLPVTPDGMPDFALMEDIIKAIQKVVLTAIVHYTERKIEATRQVVSRES